MAARRSVTVIIPLAVLHNESGTVHKKQKKGLRAAQKRIVFVLFESVFVPFVVGSRFLVQSKKSGIRSGQHSVL